MAELVLSSPAIKMKCSRFPPQSRTVSAAACEDLHPGPEAGTRFAKVFRWNRGGACWHV